MSKSSTSVNRKALKLDDKKWKLSVWVHWALIQWVINHCDRWWEKLLSCGQREGCWSYPDNEHSLKKTWDSIDDFENNISSSTSCYWKLYFCLLNIFIYLFVCFIQIISDWDKNNIWDVIKNVYLQLMQNISSNNQTPSYKGHLSIVVILSNSPRWPL
jgi:hypothetical protein